MNSQQKIYQAVKQLFSDDPRLGTVIEEQSESPKILSVADMSGNCYCVWIQEDPNAVSTVERFSDLKSSFGQVRYFLTSNFFLWRHEMCYFLSKKDDPEYYCQLEEQTEGLILNEAYKQIAEEMLHVV